MSKDAGQQWMELHDIGAKKYKAAWLHANDAAVQAAMGMGHFNLSDYRTKLLISSVVYRVLGRLKVEGLLKP